MSLVISSVYSLDLNLSTEDLYYKVQMNMDIIVKKNKVVVAWDHPNDEPRPETFTLELLTNSTVDKETGNIYCGGSYVIADNITDYQYKWKVIKLQKTDMYSFLVRANGYKKFGLSKTIYYAPNLYKFIRLGKGNSTLYIPYQHEDYLDDDGDANVVNDIFNNITVNNYIPPSRKMEAISKTNQTAIDTNAPIPNNSLPNNPTPDSSVPDNSVKNGSENDNSTENNNTSDRQVIIDGNAEINKAISESKKPRIPMTLLIIIVTGILVLAVIFSVSVFVQQKHAKFMRGGDSIILEKSKSNTSYSEGYTEDFNDYKSEATIDSVAVRERLKREALAIERKKVLESLSEKKLTSGSSNYISTSKESSEVFSNPTTDFSWQGMEVMAFTPIRVSEDQRMPIHHKPYNEISLSLEDVDHIDGYEADITQNHTTTYSPSLHNNILASSLLDDLAVRDNAPKSDAINPSNSINDKPGPSTTIDIKE